MVTDDAWFRAIEEHFVGLRGAPFLLSPADWHLAAGWRRRGMPLGLVLDAISDVFATAAARGRRTPIQSLKYCGHAVEEAFARREEALVGRPGEAARPTPDPVGLLAELGARVAALALPASAAPRVAGALGDVGRELGRLAPRLAAGEVDREGAESALAAIDRRLLQLLEEALTPAEADELQARCERRLEEMGGRMTAAERAQTRSRMLATELRRRWGVPRLTVMQSPGGPDGD